MAKSSRSSTKKYNNQRKAASIFGPVESARAERLSARLLELAKQPKPETSDVKMITGDAEEAAPQQDDKATGDDEAAMVLDSEPSKARIGKKGIDKRRRQKKSGIVFRKYSDRVASKNKAKGGK